MAVHLLWSLSELSQVLRNISAADGSSSAYLAAALCLTGQGFVWPISENEEENAIFTKPIQDVIKLAKSRKSKDITRGLYRVIGR